MKDQNFEGIMHKLKDIHKEFPDLRFGLVLQVAMDEQKRTHNANFNDISSKQILAGLTVFDTKTKDKRNKNKGDKNANN